MNYFKCCRHCELPKRYPGCAGSCDEYKSERKHYDTDKAKDPGRSAVNAYEGNKYAKFRDTVNKRKKTYPGIGGYGGD